MTYRDELAALAEGCGVRALAILDALDAGTITEEEAVDMLSALIGRANAQAVVLADLSLAAAVTIATGTYVPPLGLRAPEDDVPRLSGSVATILAKAVTDDLDRRRASLDRVARNEPVRAATRAYEDGMAASDAVTGYRRGVEPDACEQCAIWHYRDGYIWPKDKPFWRHTGCTCHPIPTTDPIPRKRNR